MTWLFGGFDRFWEIFGWSGLISGFVVLMAIIVILQETFNYSRSPADVIEPGKATSPKPIIVTLSLLGSIALGLSWVAVFLSIPTSFNPPWPDAIHCKAPLGISVDKRDRSNFIFYYNGVRLARYNVGSVAGYFLVGGYDTPIGYVPHEIWFRESDMTMVRPRHFGVDEERLLKKDKEVFDELSKKFKKEEEMEKRYVVGFLPEIDCGSDDMGKIKARGNAFSFGRKM